LVDDPGQLPADSTVWIPATVPGTAASALRSIGRWQWGDEDQQTLDGSDWWYRCRFDAPDDPHAAPWIFESDGLATVADVWLNGTHVLHSENMWLGHRIRIGSLLPSNELVLRFSALGPLLDHRRPRPRWRSVLLRNQNLRWFRTTLLGRINGWAESAAPVGPWRPLRLIPAGGRPLVVDRHLVARCDGDDGIVHVHLVVEGVSPGTAVHVRVEDRSVRAETFSEGNACVVDATVRLTGVERWWPHSHGGQRRYPVEMVVGEERVAIGLVGFRTVEVDRSDRGFTLMVNGVPVFCRGAVWVPPDVVTLGSDPATVAASLRKVVDVGMNMLRVAGVFTYESEVFWDQCDALGILVWQDCMLATIDPPEQPEFVDGLTLELRQQFGQLQGRPALAVLCGSCESQQQAAMFGLQPAMWESPLLEKTIPALAESLLPGVPYLASSPTGGDLPFDPSEGVAHYFGVGAYLRPVSDARTAGVRFAAECLCFSIPPEVLTVGRAAVDSSASGHDPGWKEGVPRDPGRSWDFDDVREEYVRQVFGIDPFRMRYVDPDRALDFGRAAVSQVMTTVMSEWRTTGSLCQGALVLSWQDLRPGAGWGLIDVDGRPKAPWYALRRILAPVALLTVDEGLAGLRFHVVNDRPTAFHGTLRLTLFDPGGLAVEEVERSVEVGARSQRSWSDAGLLGGFRDLTDAYRFGPPGYDVVRAQLEGSGVSGEAIHLPTGPSRPLEADLGLECHVSPNGDRWRMAVSTRRFAQWVAIDVPGFIPEDSWFHLAPGDTRTMALHRVVECATPRGRVRALNGLRSVPIIVDA
jgi:beta-mannosidase